MGVMTLLLAVAALLAPPQTTAFTMPSEGMVPTVEIGGRVTATVGAYDGREVERGDIVLVHPPSVVEDSMGRNAVTPCSSRARCARRRRRG